MHSEERLAVVALDAQARVTTAFLKVAQELVGEGALLPSDVAWGHGLDAILFLVNPEDWCLKCRDQEGVLESQVLGNGKQRQNVSYERK